MARPTDKIAELKRRAQQVDAAEKHLVFVTGVRDRMIADLAAEASHTQEQIAEAAGVSSARIRQLAKGQ